MATDIDKALNENPVPRGKRETTVDLADSGPRKDGDASPALPHESDQQPGSQSPAADQDKTPEAKDAYRDAKLGRPDTSSAPLWQQPSPQDKSG